jgi:PhnB protein
LPQTTLQFVVFTLCISGSPRVSLFVRYRKNFAKAKQKTCSGVLVFKSDILLLNIKTTKQIIMAQVSTYLNFARQTEEAFNYYKSIFGTELIGQGFMRFKDTPGCDEMGLTEKDKNLIMHVALPILGGHVIMGTDAPESMNFKVNFGNNVYICLSPDTREETRRLFKALSEGGKVEQELQDMFWGDYYGSCKDKFGVQWMFNCSAKE